MMQHWSERKSGAQHTQSMFSSVRKLTPKLVHRLYSLVQILPAHCASNFVYRVAQKGSHYHESSLNRIKTRH